MKNGLLLLILSFFTLTQTNEKEFYQKLSKAAIELTKQRVTYNPEYFKISYPKGDVPQQFGVCTDVVIRAYRLMGIDLQKLVHQDMEKNFNRYPQNWGLKAPDSNIDHRRVPNLMVFFKRFGKELPMSTNAKDYLPGDIVCWKVGTAYLHIGLLVDFYDKDNATPYAVHNIGAGQVMENMLFKYKIIGHYRYGT